MSPAAQQLAGIRPSLQIGVFVRPGAEKGDKLLRGILEGMSEWPEAEAQVIPLPKGAFSLQQLQQYDGLLMDGFSLAEGLPEDWAGMLNRPVISFANLHIIPGIPRSVPNEERIGRLAAEHLLQQGYEQFLCVAREDNGVILQRVYSFRERLEEEGRSCTLLPEARGLISQEIMNRELEKIAKPAGFFCWSYAQATLVLKTALELDLQIPSEVGVLGPNFDRRLQRHCPIPMTCLDLHWELCGKEAVRMLRGWMDGQRPSDVICDQVDLRPRGSTELQPRYDTVITRCLSYIQQELDGDLSMASLAICAGASERLIHLRFRQELGTTPARYVMCQRIERARELLGNTDLPVYEIAQICGFEDPNYFSTVFKRETGMSPRAFRNATPEST